MFFLQNDDTHKVLCARGRSSKISIPSIRNSGNKAARTAWRKIKEKKLDVWAQLEQRMDDLKKVGERHVGN